MKPHTFSTRTPMPMDPDVKCYFCETDRDDAIAFTIPPNKKYHIDCLVSFIENSVNEIENIVEGTRKFNRINEKEDK